MRRHKLVVESYPFGAKHYERELAPMRDADNKQDHVIFVDGYDTKRPLEYVERMLLKELSKFGRILHISLHKERGGPSLSRYAYVQIEGGIGTIERMLQQCGCAVEGLEDIKLSRVDPPERVDVSTCDMPPLSAWAPVMAATATEFPNLPEPPPEGKDPPPPWECRVDSETGCLFFWNPNTGVEFKKPRSASPIRYTREDPHLPKPWKRLADSYGYSYWWNTETNVTQYEKPPCAAPPMLLQEVQRSSAYHPALYG
ncbi:unnamed protein product [Microthlaspi erraticum]|uniref:WW domain-containing protein n=1 Tax=Microthlaspi erraticum TaxID=1685480 RepID=A0A6D2KGX8_9BRAS|nr:unnamed protein product [Microthlaspi erraticum]